MGESGSALVGRVRFSSFLYAHDEPGGYLLRTPLRTTPRTYTRDVALYKRRDAIWVSTPRINRQPANCETPEPVNMQKKSVYANSSPPARLRLARPKLFVGGLVAGHVIGRGIFVTEVLDPLRSDQALPVVDRLPGLPPRRAGSAVQPHPVLLGLVGTDYGNPLTLAAGPKVLEGFLVPQLDLAAPHPRDRVGESTPDVVETRLLRGDFALPSDHSQGNVCLLAPTAPRVGILPATALLLALPYVCYQFRRQRESWGEARGIMTE